MTTEIAVLNRLGVALATDSAVTITGNGRTKIFDSADKLFELSCEHPVAIMVNGNMDCFGLPWEIAIKDFRTAHGADSRKTISEWTADFLTFAGEHKDIGNTYIDQYMNYLADREVNLIKDNMINKLWSVAKITPRKNSLAIIPELAAQFSRDRLDFLNGIDVAKSLNNITREEIIKKYGDMLLIIIKDRFAPIIVPDEVVNSILNQVSQASLVMQPNDYSTGLIVSGFGSDDTFPSLCSVDVEGFLLGRLKHSDIKNVASIESKDLGHVVSFAQTDVIERLLSGVDPRFVEEIADFIKKTIETIGKEMADFGTVRRFSKAEKIARFDAISSLAILARDQYLETSETLRAEFKQEFEKMIAMMPKLEIIELAEALVSITAIERKATADEGTVGGPIDVAFVTKHEGFVWIKRKHYFDPALNPRYFWRKFNLGKRE